MTTDPLGIRPLLTVEGKKRLATALLGQPTLASESGPEEDRFLSAGGVWEERFHFLERLPNGGMGAVYVVYDRQVQLLSVAKSYRDVGPWEGVGERRGQLAQEIQLWVDLPSHPHLVRAMYVETLGEQPFVFLELVDGGDLEDYVAARAAVGETVPHNRALLWFLQLCEGMEFAHAYGLRAHRDLKPSNCLITQDGVLKVTDFGLAVPADELAQRGAGTPAFMAPEQEHAPERVGEPTDIYGAGAVLYFLLTGGYINDRREENELDWGISPVDERLKALVQQCCAHEIPNRYPTFTLLRRAAEQVYRDLYGEVPPSLSVAQEPASPDWFVRAIAYRELGERDPYVAQLKQAAQDNPTDFRPWFYLGTLADREGQPAQAVAYYQEALARRPDHPETLLVAASKLPEAQWEQAEAMVLTALPNAFYPATAWLTLAQIRFGAGNVEGAADACRKVLEVAPNHIEAQMYLAHCCRTLGDTDTALELWYSIIEDERVVSGRMGVGALETRQMALKSTAMAHLLRQEYETALVDARAATDSGLDDGVGWYIRSQAAAACGQYNEVRQAISRTLELLPAWDKALEQAGMMSFLLDNNEAQALAYFRQAELNGGRTVAELTEEARSLLPAVRDRLAAREDPRNAVP